MSLSARLNQRVTIQSIHAGQDAAGQPTTAWEDVATVWAEIKDISGSEFITADATQATVTTRISIRHRPGILPTMRVLHGADVYKLAAVLGQDNRSLVLMCSRGTQ